MDMNGAVPDGAATWNRSASQAGNRVPAAGAHSM